MPRAGGLAVRRSSRCVTSEACCWHPEPHGGRRGRGRDAPMTAPSRVLPARTTQPSTSIRPVLRHPAGNGESLESAPLLAGAAAFVVGLAVAWIFFWGRNVPIAGPGSLGQFVAIGG